MSEEPTTSTPACDVVGCDEPVAGNYLDTRDARRFEFRVCADHRERLVRGEQPQVVAERVDLAQLYVRPALLMK